MCTWRTGTASTIGINEVQGMELLADYEYVAIFDADFKPEPDFLANFLLTSYADKLCQQCRLQVIKFVGQPEPSFDMLSSHQSWCIWHPASQEVDQGT